MSSAHRFKLPGVGRLALLVMNFWSIWHREMGWPFPESRVPMTGVMVETTVENYDAAGFIGKSQS